MKKDNSRVQQHQEVRSDDSMPLITEDSTQGNSHDFVQNEINQRFSEFKKKNESLSGSVTNLPGTKSMFRKHNFKHGLSTQDTQNDTFESTNPAIDRLPRQHDATMYQQSVLTQSTIDFQIDKNALANRKDTNGEEAIQKVVQARKIERRLREAHQQCTEFIENGDNDIGLLECLQQFSDLQVFDIADQENKTLLHECTFNDASKCTKALMNIAREKTLSAQQLAEWINRKDSGDGFTALHFASFKGNPDLCELLIQNGADVNVRNNFGINMLHVAAQGDQPISIYFFKLKGMDLRSTDNRGSTALHWAAYSKAEITLVYLLSWVQFLDDQDCDGYTPLHLAVKSVENLQSTRPVRSLLIRGASRDYLDNQGRKPIDLADTVTTDWLKSNLLNDLAEPKDLQCLMLKTPLKLVKKSLKTPLVMWGLMGFVYLCNVLFLWPLYLERFTLIYIQIGVFSLTVFLHLIAMCKDPGHLKSPEGVTFMEMMKIFDPVLLCADCEVVRTDRSRHCSICQRCVERFDHHCPWINNCVGLDNHGIFMSFLISMFALLLVTFISLIMNFRAWQNAVYAVNPVFTEKFLYSPLFNVEFLQSRAFIETINVICLIICGTFLMLVLLLTSVQLRNFCLAKTTSERFAKAKVVQESRTSSYLEQDSISESNMSMSIVDAMQTRDHSERQCSCFFNCKDMCCLRVHPDQAKIFQIQKIKQEIGKNNAGEIALGPDAEPNSPVAKYKKYDKTPKGRASSEANNTSIQDHSNHISHDEIEEVMDKPFWSQYNKGYKVDERHSLNPADKEDDD